MSINPQLQISTEEMRRLGYQVIDELVAHFTELPDKPAMKVASRNELEAKLREPIPEHATSVDDLFTQLRRDVWSNIGNIQHPRFFGFIPTPNNFISVLADALVAGYSPFAGTWLEGAGAAQIEIITVDWLRELCGFQASTGGHFVAGGSAANLTALAVARHVKLANQLDGAVIYASEQTHSSLERALRILGFAATQLRKIAVDDALRLSLPALAAAFTEDCQAGKRPFCVIANAGTTNTGAVDPLNELADFCAANDLWLHVDGAYGAAAMLCERGKQALSGIERADSLSLDPHKWLFQPYECGCILVRQGELLRETFHVMPEYLKDTELGSGEINFCEQGVQLTRCFRALKVWLSFKAFGVASFRAAVERGFELAEYAEKLLNESAEWEVVSPAQMGIVAFRYVNPRLDEAALNLFVHEMVAAMTRDSFAFASSTVIHGKAVIRLCTINPRTTDEDIRASLVWMAKLGRALSAQM